MTILVCGGRGYQNRAVAFSVLDKVNPSRIIHGGARGADSLAQEWAYLHSDPDTIISAWNTLQSDVPPEMFDYRQDLARARASVSNVENRLAHTMRERDEALARLLKIGACRDGYPHYCPNCDRTFTATTSEARP